MDSPVYVFDLTRERIVFGEREEIKSALLTTGKESDIMGLPNVEDTGKADDLPCEGL